MQDVLSASFSPHPLADFGKPCPEIYNSLWIFLENEKTLLPCHTSKPSSTISFPLQSQPQPFPPQAVNCILGIPLIIC